MGRKLRVGSVMIWLNLYGRALCVCVCMCRFACSTSVNELPGKGQGSEVVIQGHLEGVADFLSRSYGVPKRYIDVKMS